MSSCDLNFDVERSLATQMLGSGPYHGTPSADYRAEERGALSCSDGGK